MCSLVNIYSHVTRIISLKYPAGTSVNSVNYGPCSKFCLVHYNVSQLEFQISHCFSSTIITSCKQSLGQGNIFTLVCHSVHTGDLLQCMPGYHPLGPGTPTPQDHAPPSAEHAGRYGQHAGGMHPTGM